MTRGRITQVEVGSFCGRMAVVILLESKNQLSGLRFGYEVRDRLLSEIAAINNEQMERDGRAAVAEVEMVLAGVER